MNFDISQETVIIDWLDDEAIIRYGNEMIYVSMEDIDDDKQIGDSIEPVHLLRSVCSDCSSEKLYDEKNQVYYCPKCEQ